MSQHPHARAQRPEPQRGEPEPATRPTLQQRVAAAILDAAAHTISRGGEQASMADVAVAAGVARATVYRYFPNRQALVDAVTDAAGLAAKSRLASARLEAVPLEEGVRRVVRAFVETGDYFVVLARERAHGSPAGLAPLLRPVRDVLERGQKAGRVRNDVGGTWLAKALVALVQSALVSEGALGRDDTVAVVTDLFLNGIANDEGHASWRAEMRTAE